MTVTGALEELAGERRVTNLTFGTLTPSQHFCSFVYVLCRRMNVKVYVDCE